MSRCTFIALRQCGETLVTSNDLHDAADLRARLEEAQQDFTTAKKLVELAKASANSMALASAYLAAELGDDALGLFMLADANASDRALKQAIVAHADCVFNINDALDALTLKSMAAHAQVKQMRNAFANA